MADVRLTATNPDDSTVVPVACNAKGELKLEEPPTFDGNLSGDLSVSGNASVAGKVNVGGLITDVTDNGVELVPNGIVTARRSDSANVWVGYQTNKSDGTSFIRADGSADFQGGVLVNPNSTYATYLGRGSGGASVPGYIETKRDCEGSGDVASFSGNDGSVKIRGDGGMIADGTITASSFASMSNIAVNGSEASAFIQVNGQGPVGVPSIWLKRAPGYTSTTDIALSANAVIRSEGSIRNVCNDNGFFEWRIGGDDSFLGTSGADAVMKLDSRDGLVVEKEVTVTSRGSKYVLTEQGGICYMMAPSSEFDEGFSQAPPRDIIKELDQLKEIVQTLINSRNETD